MPLGLFWQDFLKTNSTVSETFICHGCVVFAPQGEVYIDGGTWGPSQNRGPEVSKGITFTFAMPRPHSYFVLKTLNP